MEAESPLNEAVEWFIDHLKVEKGAAMHTLAAYARDLGEAMSCFEGIARWEQLTPEAMLRWDAHLAAQSSPRTAQRKASALRSLLKFLKRNGVAIQIDLPSTGGFRAPKRLPKALPSTVVQDVIQGAETDSRLARRNVVLLELLFGCGLRVSEVVALRTSEVDLEARVLRVTGKRGKMRVIPVPVGTMSALSDWLKSGRDEVLKKPSGLVFVSAKGGALSRQAVYGIIAAAARAGGVTGYVGPHTMRHSYAVSLLKGGADLRAVQELLGHESVATTQVYTELADDEVKNRYMAAHPRG